MKLRMTFYSILGNGVDHNETSKKQMPSRCYGMTNRLAYSNSESLYSLMRTRGKMSCIFRKNTNYLLPHITFCGIIHRGYSDLAPKRERQNFNYIQEEA